MQQVHARDGSGRKELIVDELRQLRRSEHGRVVHEQRGVHLRVSMLARMQIEHELADWIGRQHELPTPSKGRISRQSRHFPVASTVQLQPDERGHYLLSVTATDRLGLLYSIARVLGIKIDFVLKARTTSSYYLDTQALPFFLLGCEKLLYFLRSSLGNRHSTSHASFPPNEALSSDLPVNFFALLPVFGHPVERGQLTQP